MNLSLSIRSNGPEWTAGSHHISLLLFKECAHLMSTHCSTCETPIAQRHSLTCQKRFLSSVVLAELLVNKLPQNKTDVRSKKLLQSSSFLAEIIWKNCKVRPKYKAELCSFRTLGVRTWQFILHMFIWRIKQSCWKGFELCNFPNFAVPNFAVSTVVLITSRSFLLTFRWLPDAFRITSILEALGLLLTVKSDRDGSPMGTDCAVHQEYFPTCSR